MFAHFAIPVKDLEASKKFYIENFELKFHKDWERKKDNLKSVQLIDKNGIILELIQDVKFFRTCRPWVFVKSIIPHLGFIVENIEEKMKSFKKQGIEIVWPIKSAVTAKKIAFIKDPDDFPIELIEENKK
jgi:predicted enzyme related to lactoylglutathione lyase